MLRSAAQIADAVRERQLSPVEVVREHLERIEKLNPQINAFVEVDAERAMVAARAAEAAVMRGDSLGPLHGVPISIKSSIAVAGLRQECGSRLRAGVCADADATLVARLKRAGAIVLGTTNVPEFLMAWETDNRLNGRTNHPLDTARTAGGSSGGEAAAIASGMSAAGIGSDGGGSIRVPAHFCGICGLKPTPGRVSIAGHFPASLGPFTQLGVVGPMARTVADLRLMLQATDGLDFGDVRSVRLGPIAPPQEIHIGWFVDNGVAPVTAETRAAVRTAADRLTSHGMIVEPFVPVGLEGFFELFMTFFGSCVEAILEPTIDSSPLLTDYFSRLAEFPRPDFPTLVQRWMARDQMRLDLLRQMERYPVLLSPVCSTPAFRHGERSWTIDGRTVDYLRSFSYCQLCNLLGLPAAVVPVGKSPEGLPIGVQVIGRPFEEEVVLAVAERLEQSRL